MSAERQPNTQVVLLGTGTPNADPRRSGPAVAILVGGTPYVVDCGPGVVRRAAAVRPAGVPGLDVCGITRLFVTHLHSDHTAGYPDLILTPWVLGREEPLQVYGPVGLQVMTEHLLAAYGEDIRERVEGLEPANGTGFSVSVVEIEADGQIYQDQNVRVEAFAVNHGSWPAYGYRFSTPDRTVVLSGDTAPFEGWAEAYRNADVLVHEVYSAVGFEAHTPEWQRYHSRVHTSSWELAAVAAQAQPELLVLYHQLFNGVSEEALLQEVQERYTGQVVSGKDLGVY